MPRIASLAKMPAAILTGMKKAWHRQASIVALERLSDHALADIGIERGHIPELVDVMMAWGKAEPAPARTVFASKPVQPAPAGAGAVQAVGWPRHDAKPACRSSG